MMFIDLNCGIKNLITILDDSETWWKSILNLDTQEKSVSEVGIILYVINLFFHGRFAHYTGKLW